MARPKKTESIVTPVIRANGEEHILEALEKLDEMPTLVSVGVSRVSATSRDYISYVITSRGKEILDIEVSEPNLRAIAEESGKIDFVNKFCSGEDV